MFWQDFHGHAQVLERFRHRIQAGRLASTFLFVGPAGVGKATFADKLCQALLCQNTLETDLDACGRCSACTQYTAGSHPDVIKVSRPKDRAFIPVEKFIGQPDKRMREGLIHHLALKPQEGGRRIAVIDDADALNEEGANSLLKTLEEPPPRSILILVGTSEQKQLPTIRSRSQVIRFGPLPDNLVAQILLEREIVADATEAEELAVLAGGSVHRAVEWRLPGFVEFRSDLNQVLARPPWPALKLTRLVQSFVDAAGKDAPAKRKRFLVVTDAVVRFLGELLRLLSGTNPGDQTDQAIASCGASWPADEDAVLDCIDRCVDAESQLLRNANITGLIECWCDDISRLAVAQ